MNFKFHDAYGREVLINDPAMFNAYVRDGWIKADTLIFDAQTGMWKRAWEMSEFHAANGGNYGQPEYGAPPDYQTPPTYGTNPGYQTPPTYNNAPPTYNNAPPTYGAPGPSGAAYGSVPYGYGYAAPDEQSSGTGAIALGVVLLCASFMAVMITGVKYSLSPARAGYRIGVTLVFAALIGVVAFVIQKTAFKNRRGIALLLLGIGVFGVAIFQSVAAYREGQVARNTIDNMASQFKGYMDGKPPSSLDFDESKYGELAPAVKVIGEYIQGVQSDMTAMNGEMEALHLETMLARETLQDAPHIANGKQRVTTMREMLDRYESKLRQRADDIPVKINAAKMAEDQKREFMNGFNSTKDKGLADIREFFEIERAFADKLDELFDFMRGRQGRYRFSGSQVLFNSTGDANVYNQHLTDIRTIAQREDAWRVKMQRQGSEQIDQMQKLLKR
jgi:hypothetical protein